MYSYLVALLFVYALLKKHKSLNDVARDFNLKAMLCAYAYHN